MTETHMDTTVARPAVWSRRWLSRHAAVVLALASVGFSALAADVDLKFANLHNPYFTDRHPDAPAGQGGTYVMAPAPSRLFGVVGDTVPVPFTVVSPVAQRAAITVRLYDGAGEVGGLGPGGGTVLRMLRVRDVHVEGNSNANCSCPAGESAQSAKGRNICVRASEAAEGLTPKGCPSADERAKIGGTLVRGAPFAIKDALEPVADPNRPQDLAAGTELFLIDVPITAQLPRSRLELRVTVKPADGAEKTIAVPLRVLALKLEGFPSLDLSYWSSEDPRDSVARPAGTPLNGRWGGEWWSEMHWRNIERLAKLQGSLGVTSTLVPLFVRNPFGIDSKPLIPVRCITGADAAAGDPSPSDGTGQPSPAQLAAWHYEFDFRNFRHWISVFREAGFRQFEGAHLFANGGELPNYLECDLYRDGNDTIPYARGVRLLSRSGASAETGLKDARRAIYREKFLPEFLRQLAEELRKLGIENRYVQHVIDENAPTEAAVEAYVAGASVVRRYLPGIRTIDAINQYSAPRYRSLIDVPVLHVALVYDDQMRRRGIRQEIEDAFPGRKYLYNTALRGGGPNRFLDTNPLDSRVYPWLALETGYNGLLYWASNSYRYPTEVDYRDTGRPEDWTPYRYSIGPIPHGYVSPGLGAGSNWILYPISGGLVDSLRARRLRDGLLDHWIYMRTWNKCKAVGDGSCLDKLRSLRGRLTGDIHAIADFSRDPALYDLARETMLSILEP